MFSEKRDVIVLELEQGRYYIEHSNEPPEAVFDDHKNGTSNWEAGLQFRDCIFTKKFKETVFFCFFIRNCEHRNRSKPAAVLKVRVF